MPSVEVELASAGPQEAEAAPTVVGLPIGSPWVIEPAEPSEAVVLSKAAAGEVMCSPRVLAEVDRVVAYSAEYCRRPSDAEKQLVDATNGKVLTKVFRVKDYSPGLEALIVEQPGGLSPVTFVSTRDGSRSTVDGRPEYAGETFSFIDGSPAILATSQSLKSVRVLTELPTTRVDFAAGSKTDFTPFGGHVRHVPGTPPQLEWRNTKCKRVRANADGSGARCDVSLPPELERRQYRSMERPFQLLTDEWFIVGADPRTPAHAYELSTMNVIEPTTRVCEYAKTVSLPPSTTVPRLLFECDDTRHLWTPERTIEVQDTSWSPTAHGNIVQFDRLSPKSRQWLDLRSLRVYESVGLELVADGVALESRSDLMHRVWTVDLDAEVRAVGEVPCAVPPEASRAGDIVEVRCPGEPVDGCSTVATVTVFDLESGRFHEGKRPLLGVTKSRLIFGDGPEVPYAKCGPTGLVSLPRVASSAP